MSASKNRCFNLELKQLICFDILSLHQTILTREKAALVLHSDRSFPDVQV